MKKQVAILLLICYSVALVKPLVPAFSDFMSHTFWNSEHIATVHFENGKYHLHVEMEKAGKEDQQSKQTKIAGETTFHLKSTNDNFFIQPKITAILPTGMLAITTNCFLLITSPPPKA